MIKKILILNGSPRMKGNTAVLIGKLAEGIREVVADAEIEIIALNSMRIRPCQACGGCRREGREGKYCVIQDDMSPLYDIVLQAD